jgi:hypothetical protein
MKKSARRNVQETCATKSEVMAAIESVSAEDFYRLKRAAAFRIRGLGRAAQLREYGDLLNEALASTLQGAEGGPRGRKWANQRVPFVKHLLGAMRSIASRWKDTWERGPECEMADWLTAKDGDEGETTYATDQAADARGNPDGLYLARELFEELDKHFAEDEDARLLARIDGLTVAEMVTTLQLSEKKVNAAYQRIRYFIEMKGKKGA